MNDDAQLVALAKAGDFAAFEALTSRHERRLYTLAMSLTRAHEDAQDVVQTSFLKALENLDGFRDEATFGSWMTRITTNTALNLLRKRKGLTLVSLSASTEENEDGEIPHPEFIADWRFDPEKAVEQARLRKILETAIDSLDEKYRLVFLLRDVEELTVEETAQMLGISEANVKVRLLRARLALREKLNRVFGDETRQLATTHRHTEGEPSSTPASKLVDSYRMQYRRSTP